MSDTVDSAGATSAHSASDTGPRTHRVVLVAHASFDWLRGLQMRAPGPRLDLRYLVEGTLLLLQERPDLMPQWIDASREALLAQLIPSVWGVGPGAAAHNEVECGDACVADAGTGRAAGASGHGAGEGHALAEGGGVAMAPARTRRGSWGRGRHGDCRALQIGEVAFRWLKGVQDSTFDPRLEMRCLLEGATALLQQRSDLLPLVVERARGALATHLAHLRDQTVPPISMEIPQ
jgi:hypothetical protein